MPPAMSHLLPALLLPLLLAQAQPPIDRQAVISRHNITLRALDHFGTLSVGNGDFAFNADITGLQSFPAYYEKSLPLGILSSWGWHSFPNPGNYSLDNFNMTIIPKHNRQFVYPASSTSDPPPDAAWLRTNPHKFGLARLGLDMTTPDGRPVLITDVRDIEQTLDLWTGILTSSFTIRGTPVKVETASHGIRDEIATRITSPLLAAGRLKLRLAFPYASSSFGPDYHDWTKPDAHTTTLVPSKRADTLATFTRTLDDTRYTVTARWSLGVNIREAEKHNFLLTTSSPSLEFTAWFAPRAPDAEPDSVDALFAASRDHWKAYWSSGGIIDLSGNTDPRAHELERRLILSQYLMKVHDASSWPPAETGLAANSWFGKFHMEMYWWHAAHWALWGRPELLEKSLKNLHHLMPEGEKMAARQGARGVKWSKMTAPNGVESPSGVGPALVWQQPHPIYLAELVYRAKKDKATLDAYKDIVFATADYLASFVDWDDTRKQYVLGPGIASADEGHTNYAQNLNPAMEIGYWKWALRTAQLWRTRLGLPPDETYAKVIAGLAPPPIRNGVYTAVELPEETTPSWMATWLYGILPGENIDKTAMRKTLDAAAVSRTRAPQAAVTWGNAMVTICAARMNDPELATSLLAVPFDSPRTNPFRPNGTTVRRPDQTPLYMPANGGWLAAAAIMAAGWDNHTSPTPGFPKSWKVRHEGLIPAP